MAGFENDVVVAKNLNFDEVAAKPHLGILNSGGKLAIGTGNTFPTPEILGGNITSPGGSITVSYATPDITLEVNGGAVGQTITGDSGGALLPTAGNWNIFGLSGSKTSGTGSTLTIKSPPYAAFPATATAAVNTGSFITAGGNIILDLPVTAADGDLIEVVCTTANLIAVDAPALNFIRIGTLITSGGGTATSTQIGDALVLRYRLADLTWYATSLVGTWVMA